MNRFETEFKIEAARTLRRAIEIPATEWVKKTIQKSILDNYSKQNNTKEIVEVDENNVSLKRQINKVYGVTDYEFISGNRFNYNNETFFISTHANWTESETTFNREPDFTSESSRYFYTDAGVYRVSNHWGLVASCSWYVKTSKKTIQCFQGNADQEGQEVCGFCQWGNFTNNK